MSNPVSGLKTFFSGMCVGAADLVPGISGGTVALILGIYEPLIDGLRSFDGKFIRNLFSGSFKEAFSRVPLGFLGSVLTGIAFAIVMLVHLIKAILSNPDFRPLLYGLFFGLVLASAHMIIKRIQVWKLSYIIIALIGCASAYMLTGFNISDSQSNLSYELTGPLSAFWVFFCGMAGICAMLLPGISGGYLLNILGMYGRVIAALSEFVKGFLEYRFDMDAFLFLAVLGSGVLFGAVLFSNLISWALHKYHDITIAALVGFMLGALKSVWPFWTYEKVEHLDRAPILNPLEPVLPSIYDPVALGALALLCVGFMLVYLANRSTRNIVKVH